MLIFIDNARDKPTAYQSLKFCLSLESPPRDSHPIQGEITRDQTPQVPPSLSSLPHPHPLIDDLNPLLSLSITFQVCIAVTEI
jgi:hypothetical protein